MKIPRSTGLRMLAAVCTAMAASTVSGQVMRSPVRVIGTNVTAFNDTVSVTNLINQSGITTPFVSGVTVFDTYFANPGQVFATSGNNGTNNWQSETAFDLGYQGFVDFDLGSVYQINKLAIWNRSLSNITVTVLNDLGGPEQVVGSFTLTNRQSSNFSYVADLFSFNASYPGRYVRLVINSVFPVQGFSFGYASAGEVVVSASPVGSPSPTVSLTHNPSGDVKVTFTGTLQSSTNVLGAFDNVPGNPVSPHTLPKASLLPQQYFRAAGN